jgi:hypothetical protein
LGSGAVLGNLAFLTWQNAFVVGSLIVAILVWVEAQLLQNNHGKLPQTRFFGSISALTSLWLLVSGIGLWFLDFDRLAIAVPVVYGIYCVVGWFYGARLINGDNISDDPSDWVIPVPYLTFCKSFAVAYTVLCMFVLLSPVLIPNFLL